MERAVPAPAPVEPHRILVVDDEPDILKLIEYTFKDEYEVLTAGSGEEALGILRDRDVALILADQRMPGMTGSELLERSIALRPHAIRMILTGYSDMGSAIEAINNGKVYLYLTKPWEETEIRQKVKRALETHDLEEANRRLAEELRQLNARLVRENVELKREVESLYGFDQIIGRSPAMQRVFDLLTRVIDSPTTVLITGETGTGKEIVARAIHYNSPRRGRLFVAQNCASLSESLLESELFGHRKGAFTGAVEEKKGLFEVADGGTIFLDEIGDMPPALQAGLLRVLQEGEIKRVGDTSVRKVDVRVISATNRDLEEAVRSGRFREDLYYRLHVFPIRMPPLRERMEDVPLLVDHFLHKYARRAKKIVTGITADALDRLQAYRFPGNVRELEHEIERAVTLLSPGEPITPDLLSEKIVSAGAEVPRPGPAEGALPAAGNPAEGEGATLRERMQAYERALILRELERHGWNRTRTARALGISLRPFMEKLKRYGITDRDR
jgi:two-component system response regulator HupR/HoxA